MRDLKAGRSFSLKEQRYVVVTLFTDKDKEMAVIKKWNKQQRKWGYIALETRTILFNVKMERDIKKMNKRLRPSIDVDIASLPPLPRNPLPNCKCVCRPLELAK